MYKRSIDYVIYLVAYLLFQGVLNGIAFQYFWPETPEIANRTNVFLVANAVFWAVIFTGSFLRIWRKPGWTRWAYSGVLAVSVVAAILGVFGDFSLAARLAPLCGILLVPMVIITFAVIMLDLDYFKKPNDRFGHQVGDKVLIEVAGVLQNNVREDDCCGRYGGEEFIVGVIQSENRNAKELAERLSNAFHKITLLGNPEVVELTASFGVAVSSVEKPTVTVDEMIQTADLALYRAKDLGRDRIIVEWVNT